MVKQVKKITKKTVVKSANTITVKNAEGDMDTTATILIQNKINYTPKVSVIIPVYNVEKYLRECLDSVINQTLKEIEIICIDDGSTDSSLDILKEYATKDNRITVITQKNLHAGVARNAGLSVAKGEYIHFLDSDDFIDTKTYTKLIDIITAQKSNIIKFCSYSFDEQTKKVVDKYFTNMGAVSPDKFGKYLSFSKDYETLVHVSDAPWSGLYNRKFLTDNKIKFDNLLCANDTSFFYRCLVASDNIYMVPKNERFVYYRINNSSSLIGIRAYNFDCQINQFDRINNIVKKLKNPDIQNHVRKHLIHAVFYRYDMYINNQNLELPARQKIFNQMLDFIKNINRNEVSEEQLFKYDTLIEKACVSIIVPVYNAEKYLHECLDSLVNQTLYNIEIICVNDGSTDNSPKILQEYAEKDNRIKIINNKKNSGAPGPVKNIGVQQASGLYIGFVDADDWVDSDYFAHLYKNAIQNNADMASALKVTQFNSEHEWTSTYDVNGNNVLDNIYRKMPLIQMSGSNWLKIYKTDFIRENKLKCWEKRCIAEDNYLSVTSMLLANKIAVTDQIAYHYRKDVKDSITGHTRTDADFNIFDVYMAIDEFVQKLPVSQSDKDGMLMAINARKTQDFTWFNNDINEKNMNKFKEKLQETYPDVYFNVFNTDGIIISLTSYPARIGTINQTIESLLNQTKKADKVILWLAPEQFPNREQDLPQQLLDLRSKGLTIDWYHDIRSYKKLIPTLRKYPNAIIVTADDDNIYQPTWLEKLYNSYKKHPHDIQAHRVTKFYHDNYGWHVISGGHDYWHGANYLNKLVGLGGVLYPPHCFYKDILNEDLIKQLAPTNDDQWFWLMGAMNGYPVRVVENPEIDAHYIPGSQETALCKVNDNGQKLFWKDFQRLMEYYPKAKEILTKESKKHTVKKDFVAPYKKELEQWYTKRFGPLNLDDPKTFNEKIQWSKIYDSTPIKTRLADKYLVRDWVAEKIGDEYLIPLLGVYDSFEEIDFDKLPNQFVIKTNHGSGTNIIVKDKSKLDLTEVKTKLNKWMAEDFAFKYGYELHYRDIPRKIIIEKYMDDGTGSDLQDYKIMCFNGKPEFIWVDTDRSTDHKRNFFDLNWHEMDIKMHPKYGKKKNIPAPKTLKQMINFAKILSAEFNMVRVDFYEISGKLYFGEMTFTSSSGTEQIVPASFDRYLGNLFKLPKRAYNIDTGEYYDVPKPAKKHVPVKPYLLMPYYLLANIWMKVITIPLAKFVKHTKQVWYSHSARGHMDKILQSIQSAKKDIYQSVNKDIYEQIKNLKTDVQKQTDFLKDDITNRTNTLKDIISKETDSLKDNINEQINSLKDDISKRTDSLKDDTKKQNKTLETLGCLYRYDNQTRWAIEHGMTEITNAPNFEQRFMNLIKGMPFESKATVTDIITRLQLIKDGEHHDLFNAQEKQLLKQVTDFENSVLKISDDKYWCNDYLLPINHFEASVFFYKHGLSVLNNPEYFKTKAILDIGAFIGDSALILSPLTSDNVYCFEGCQENYDNMLKTIEINNLKNIVPVKSAVGDYDGEIELFYYGGATSIDKNMVKRSTRSEKTKIIRVDDYVREHKINVGLIKVDIEGAEQSFLRGARKTIEKYKPTLLISIYHNVDDFLDIKPMIESWNLGYKFKIFKPTIGSVSAETLLICEQ